MTTRTLSEIKLFPSFISEEEKKKESEASLFLSQLQMAMFKEI